MSYWIENMMMKSLECSVEYIKILKARNAMLSMHIIEPAFNSLEVFDPTKELSCSSNKWIIKELLDNTSLPLLVHVYCYKHVAPASSPYAVFRASDWNSVVAEPIGLRQCLRIAPFNQFGSRAKMMTCPIGSSNFSKLKLSTSYTQHK